MINEVLGYKEDTVILLALKLSYRSVSQRSLVVSLIGLVQDVLVEVTSVPGTNLVCVNMSFTIYRALDLIENSSPGRIYYAMYLSQHLAIRCHSYYEIEGV